jgi:hypothetical protein
LARTQAVVGIIGAAALRKDLLHLGDAAGPIVEQIKVAGRTAAEPVLTKARAAWPRSDLAHPHHADSLRVIGVKTGATIAEGGKAYGGTGFIEFGGRRNRTYEAGGRFLFPAAVSLQTVVVELYASGIQAALDSSSSWTNTTTSATEVAE